MVGLIETSVFKDPFFIFGSIFILTHLVTYYKLLCGISNKIKEKRNGEIEDIEFKKEKLNQQLYIVSLHKQIHKIEETYDLLNEKLTAIFQLGVCLFVLSVAGFARNFIGFITPGVIGIIKVLMIIIGAGFLIHGYSILSWNIKN